MEIKQQDLKRCVLITLIGRIDGTVAPDFGKFMRVLTDTGNRRLVLNMAEVSYTSSAFFRELLSAQKACQVFNQGDIVLCEISPTVMKVFELLGLDTKFRILKTEAEAVGSW